MERTYKIKMHEYEEEKRRKRNKTRSKQVTPLCDIMQMRWGREGGLTSNSLKDINVRATGGQRITKWSLNGSFTVIAKEDVVYRR